MLTRHVIILLFSLTILFGAPAKAEELYAISDVHSSVSGSDHTIEELARLAESKGVDIVFLTDHTRVAMSYGLPPFRHVLRMRKERPSVQLFGPEKYLEEVARVNYMIKRVLVVPGLKAAAYYYWRGSYFSDNLTAFDYNKQLIVLGLDHPDEIAKMPVINGTPTRANLKEKLISSTIFILPLAIGLYLLGAGGGMRWAGLLVAVLSLLAIINERPLSPIRADPYTSGPTTGPYQELIDYVEGLGGLTFWVMPTSRASHKLGPATLITEPHEDDLIKTRGYTGFEVLYGDALKLHLAGSAWDQALGEFLRGKRRKPPFAITGSDFWREGKSKLAFDQYQIAFPSSERKTGKLLADLASGRIYARRRSDSGLFPRLVRFTVQDAGAGVTARSGETLVASSPPKVTVELDTQPATESPLSLTVVRDGRAIKSVSVKTPARLSFEDREVSRGGPTYYRVYAKDRKGMFIVSNPIFVDFM